MKRTCIQPSLDPGTPEAHCPTIMRIFKQCIIERKRSCVDTPTTSAYDLQFRGILAWNMLHTGACANAALLTYLLSRFFQDFFQDFPFNYTPDWTIWSSKFQKNLGRGSPSPDLTPLFFGLSSKISALGALDSGFARFGPPHFWSVVSPLTTSTSLAGCTISLQIAVYSKIYR